MAIIKSLDPSSLWLSSNPLTLPVYGYHQILWRFQSMVIIKSLGASSLWLSSNHMTLPVYGYHQIPWRFGFMVIIKSLNSFSLWLSSNPLELPVYGYQIDNLTMSYASLDWNIKDIESRTVMWYIKTSSYRNGTQKNQELYKNTSKTLLLVLSSTPCAVSIYICQITRFSWRKTNKRKRDFFILSLTTDTT